MELQPLRRGFLLIRLALNFIDQALNSALDELFTDSLKTRLRFYQNYWMNVTKLLCFKELLIIVCQDFKFILAVFGKTWWMYIRLASFTDGKNIHSGKDSKCSFELVLLLNHSILNTLSGKFDGLFYLVVMKELRLTLQNFMECFCIVQSRTKSCEKN